MVSPRRRRRLLFLTWLVVLAAAVVAIRWGLQRASPMLCGLLQKQLAEQTGGEVHFEACSVSLPQRTALVQKLKLDAPAMGLKLEVESVKAVLGGLRWRGLEFSELRIAKPTLRLKRQPTDTVSALTPGVAGKGCWVKHLERWVVQKLEIAEGGLELEAAEGRGVQLSGFSVQWFQSGGHGRFRVGVEEGKLNWEEAQESIGRLRLEAELDAGGERLRLGSGEFNLGQMLWRSSGELEDLCSAQPYIGLVSQLYLPAGMPARWLNIPEVEGHFWGRISLHGRTHQLTARAELDAIGVKLGELEPGDFRAKLSFAEKHLRLEALRIPIGEGSAQLEGELETGGAWPMHFAVETQNVSLAHVLERVGVPGSWVDFEADVKGKFIGQLFPRLSIWGDVEASTGPFVLATRSFRAPKSEGRDILQFEKSRLKFRFGILEDRVEFQNVHVEAGPNWHTQAGGRVILFFPNGGGILVEAQASKLHLADFGHIAQIPWSGSGSGRVRVAGQFKEAIEVHGEARLQELVFGGYALGAVSTSLMAKDGVLSFPSITGQKRKTAFEGRVELDLKAGSPMLVASAQVPNGRIEDLIAVLLPFHAAGELLQNQLRGKASGSVAFSSPAEKLTGTIRLDLDELELMQLPLGGGSIEVAFLEGQTLRLLPTALTSVFGALRVSGSVDLEGAMDFSATYETKSLGAWLGAAFVSGEKLSGPLAMSARVLGDFTVPNVSFAMHSAQLFWQDKSLGPLRIEGKLLGEELSLLGSPMAGVSLSAGMRLNAPYAYQMASAVELSGVSFELPMLASLKAQVKARGELSNPNALTAEADIELLRLSREGFSVANRAPVQLSYADEKFKLSFLQMEGPNTTLLAQGVLGLKDSNFSIYGTFDLRLLETLLPGIGNASGEAGITAVVGGSLFNPSISGVAELHQAQASLKAWPLALEHINAQMEFSNQRVWIHNAQALANGGRLEAQGALSWSTQGLEDVELKGQFQKINLEPLPGVPGVFSGNLNLEGGQQVLSLSGLVEVEKLRYEKPLTVEDLIGQAMVGSRSYGEAKPPEEWLKYDVTLKAGDVRIDNNLARTRLLGQVRLAGNNIQPSLYGTLEVAPGGEAYFRGNTFDLQRGLLQFSGTTNSLQLMAQSQIQEYLVLVRASGDLSNPKVALSSEPSLTETDILSVLTMGTASGEQLTSSASISLAAQAFFSVSGLERQLQNVFSGNTLLKGQQMQFATTLNEATGLTEPSVRWESKLISEQIRVGVVQTLTGKGTKFQAEWRINDRVSLRGQWDNWNQGSQGFLSGIPGVDFKFRFEWE